MIIILLGNTYLYTRCKVARAASAHLQLRLPRGSKECNAKYLVYARREDGAVHRTKGGRLFL